MRSLPRAGSGQAVEGNGDQDLKDFSTEEARTQSCAGVRRPGWGCASAPRNWGEDGAVAEKAWGQDGEGVAQDTLRNLDSCPPGRQRATEGF